MSAIPENYTGFVKFWFEGCPGCKTVKPVLDEVISETGSHLVEIDTNNDPEDLVSVYGIRSAPTIVYFKEGQIKAATVGAKKKEIFLEMLNK